MHNTPHTEASKKRMSVVQRKLWTPERRARHSVILTGRKLPPKTEASVRKQSISRLGFCWKDRSVGTDKELAAFRRCHGRVAEGKVPSIEWARTPDGLRGFLSEIGPMPTSMKKPSVGRIKHSKGYVRGNVQWEEHKENSIKRKGTRYESA
jgi:hypothetical protein